MGKGDSRHVQRLMLVVRLAFSYERRLHRMEVLDSLLRLEP